MWSCISASINYMSKRPSSSLPITGSILASFRPSKGLSYHEGATITSLDFDDSGQYLISSGIDKSIQLYDCHKGTRHKDIQSQKYGAHLARFTHHELNCLYASTPGPAEPDHLVRYLSLTTKTYLRYFKGHKDQVLALEVNPVSETFMTASADHTVKNWDLRTSTPIGSLAVGQVAVVAYDPHGIVFAVGKSPVNGVGSVLLYDASNFEKGPFATARINTGSWTKMEFSNNGKYLLVGTDSSEHYVLDAFLGKMLATLCVTKELQKGWLDFKYVSSGSVCFTSCGKFVLAGSPRGTVSVFDLAVLKETKEVVRLDPFTVLEGNGISKIVAFNPKLLTFATADEKVVLWAATEEE